MRKLAFVFLLGALIGGSVVGSLYYLAREKLLTENEQATETLDFLIGEWTAQRELPDTVVARAQLPSRIELPDARSGFFPDTVRKLAARIESLYRVPKGVTLAQWALESGWGKSNLNASNYFGHTWLAVKPFLKDTTWFVVRREKKMEGGQIVAGPAARFALYRTIAECFDVHGQYLSRSTRYANAFGAGSSELFARELSKAGYATDPDYALKLIAIMKRYRL